MLFWEIVIGSCVVCKQSGSESGGVLNFSKEL